MTITDHESIWLEPPCADNASYGRLWCQDRLDDCDECGTKAVQYIRADLAKADREAARREALEDAKAIVDNIRDNAAADGDDANAAAITNAVRSICDHLSVSIANLINKEPTNEQ